VISQLQRHYEVVNMDEYCNELDKERMKTKNI